MHWRGLCRYPVDVLLLQKLSWLEYSFFLILLITKNSPIPGIKGSFWATELWSNLATSIACLLSGLLPFMYLLRSVFHHTCLPAQNHCPPAAPYLPVHGFPLNKWTSHLFISAQTLHAIYYFRKIGKPGKGTLWSPGVKWVKKMFDHGKVQENSQGRRLLRVHVN